MTQADTVRRLAPCGLDCGKCLSHPDSPIGRLARELRTELGGFGRRAAFFAGLDPVFAGYGEFEKVLERLGAGTCAGCRTGDCLFPGCRVMSCVKERGVDFCFQCGAFPCGQTGLSGPLLDRWRANNERLGEVGVSAFFDWIKDQPRY